MLSRSTLFSTLALVVLASTSSAQEQPTQDVRQPTVAHIYAVADIVVPAPKNLDVTVSKETGWAIDKSATNERDLAVRQAAVLARAKHLMRLVGTHVAPQSWKPKGGQGTLDYFPNTMSLVVQQTPEVHERIAALLAQIRKLREKRDCQVTLEIRVLSVAEGFTKTVLDQIQELDRVQCDAKESNCFVLSDREVFLLLTSAREDKRTNVMMAPKLCTLNNRKATLRADGFEIAVHPVISEDRRHVTVSTDCAISCENCEEGKKVTRCKVQATVPDGKTIVIRGFGRIEREARHCQEIPILNKVPYINRLTRTCCTTKENHECILLVTPRIVVMEEEELRVVHPTPVLPRPTPVVVRPVPPARRVPPPLPKSYHIDVRTRMELEPAPPLPKDYFQRMQANTTAKVREYLVEYYRACEEGDEEKALTFGKRAIRLDPTCFGRQR